MANGRPSDHPLTDILHHQMNSTFPDDIVEDVRHLAAHPKFAVVRPRLADVLWNNWPLWQKLNPKKQLKSDLEAVRSMIRRLKLELEQQG